MAQALPRNLGADGLLAESAPVDMTPIQGRALVLAGSCSVATRRQIEAIPTNWASRKVDIDALATGADLAGELGDWALAQQETLPVLIYASETPQEVEDIQQRYGVEASGAMVERLLGELAHRLVAGGFNKLVVAGGETSGSVVSALDIRVLQIGPEIDTGVPWTQSLHGEPLALALKSGNFGGDDFFSKAFEVLAGWN